MSDRRERNKMDITECGQGINRAFDQRENEAGCAPSTGSGTAGFRTVHMSLSVRGALRNRDYDWFIKEDGTPATKDEAFEFLCDKLADGWEVLPIGDCDNFDKKTGCPGHRAESPNDPR
jgi:hypothetical protein